MCAASLGTFESLESRVLFAAGDLDALFSGGKVVRDLAGGDDYGFAVAIQSDGKLLVAGRAQNGASGNDFAIIRLNIDGTTDTTFGTGGKVLTDMGSSSDGAYAIAIQADGKIVVAGETMRMATSGDFAMARYNLNGSLDTTFGTGGKVVTDFSGSTDQALALTLSGSKIILAGWASVGGLPRFAVAQYTSAGALDSTFGTGGKATTAYSPGYARAQAIARLSDGSFIVAGSTVNFTTGSTDFAAVHYSSTGAVDSAFGGSGWATVDMGGDEVAHAVIVQSDGKLVLAGEYYNSDSGIGDFALARLTSAGALDSTFGTSGTVLTDFDGDYDQGTSAVQQSDGKIVVAGLATVGGNMGFGLARYNPNGSLDTSFAGGKVSIQFGTSDAANGVALDSQGRIIVGGFTSDDSGATDFAVARVQGRVNVAPIANPGGSYTVISGGSVLLDGSGSLDSDGTIASYEWDYNYDGVTFTADATGTKPTFSAAGIAGPTTRTIALRVTDNDGAATIATTTITIRALIAPVANPGGGYSLNSGASIQLDGTGSTDADGSIVLYQWDFNYDGSSFDVDATGSKPMYVAPGSLSASMTQTIALRVTDNDGQTNTATTTVSIHALINPIAKPGGPYSLNSGASIQLNGSNSSDSDGSIVKYEWDLEYNGTFSADVTGATPTFNAPSSLTTATTRTIALRVTDNDGLTSLATTTITISPVVTPPPPPPPDGITLQNDPANPGKKILILHGTAKSDFILFRSTRSGIEVQMNCKVLGRFANISRIAAYGEGGSDFIDASSADVPVALFGGAGNDILIGGRFNDILCGGDGNDNLFGGKGDDLIVGGAGSDTLHSHFGNDKLIGGVLTCENDLNQLVSLLGATKIDSKLVTDDHAVDHLNGTPGADFIVLGAGDKLHNLH